MSKAHSSKTKNNCETKTNRLDMYVEALYRPEATGRRLALAGLSAMEQIESIIFDWGGVLIDDPAPGRTRYCAAALGVSEEGFVKAQGKFITDFQKGLIGEDTFWRQLCSDLNVPKPKARSLWTDGFKAAYVPRKEMFSMASRLQENSYRTALLSNAEVPAMQYFYQSRYNMFDVCIFSCSEGTRKPERKIYELTLEKLGSKCEQSVFIDDGPEHVNAAQAMGLNTILFQSIGQVKNELARLYVKID